MKPIYLQLDELGPWLKIPSPAVTSRKKVLISNNQSSSRVRTVYVNPTAPEISSNNVSFLKVIEDYNIKEPSLLEPPAKLPLPSLTRSFQMNVKDMLLENSQFNNELISESPHITHKYFPYRQSSFNFWQKSFKPLPVKNVYPVVQKKKVFSLSPKSRKNYVFWDQRKLIGVKARE